MRVGLARQQFGGTFAHAFGTFAAQETAMVQEELQQFQVARANVAAQEEVAAQPAVEVLDDRAGADDLLAQGAHGLLDAMEAAAQSSPQRQLLPPAQRLARVQLLDIEQFADDRQGRLEVGGEFGQILVELQGESQELVAVDMQPTAERVEAMRTERRALSTRRRRNRTARSGRRRGVR